MRFLISILFFYPLLLLGNVNSDSLLSIWQNSSNTSKIRMEALATYLDEEVTQDNDELDELLLELERFAKNEMDTSYIIAAYIYRGHHEYIKGELPTSNDFYQKAVDLSLIFKDTMLLAKGYRGLGNVFNNQGKYKKANEYYFKSLEVLDLVENTEEKIKFNMGTNSNIGTIYYNLGRYNKAINYFSKSLLVQKDFENWGSIANNYNNIGICYIGIEKYDLALSYLDSSLVIMETQDILLNSRANTISNIGSIYLEKKDTSAAVVNIQKALSIYEQTDDQYHLAKARLSLAILSQGDDAIEQALLALETAKRIDAYPVQMEVYQFLHKRYRETGQHEKSLEMLEAFNEIKNKTKREESLLQLSEYEKEKELDKLQMKSEGALSSMTKKYSSKIYIILTSIIITVISFLFIIWVKSRKQKKEKEAFLKEIDKLKLQLDSNVESNTELIKGDLPFSKDEINVASGNKLNETDLGILVVLYKDPSISNRMIASEVNLSIEGVRSSLKKMYRLFDIELPKNKKLALILKVIRLSKDYYNA